MKLKPLLSFLFCIFFSISSFAQLFEGSSGQESSIGSLIANAEAGTIFVVGENHGHVPHHDNQREILKQIYSLPFDISVGMEFFEYPKQVYVDQYLNQEIEEDLFLSLMGWKNSLLSMFPLVPLLQKQRGIAFSNYREQVLYPTTRGGGKTLALNLPRKISGKVAMGGLDALTDTERELLPPNFELGSDAYFERFKETMGHHVPEESIPNYFLAQSLWDETMAWKAMEHMRVNANDFLLIIVGDFHAAYGHGLPARLKARGASKVLVVSQGTEVEDAKAHEKYGARGDFIWVAP